MADTIGIFMTSFVNMIFGIIKYIQELVQYYRAFNRGEEAEMPTFPAIGVDEGD